MIKSKITGTVNSIDQTIEIILITIIGFIHGQPRDGYKDISRVIS